LPEFAEGCAKNRDSRVFLIFATARSGLANCNFPHFSGGVDPNNFNAKHAGLELVC
jgi:hypothetical protein